MRCKSLKYLKAAQRPWTRPRLVSIWFGQLRRRKAGRRGGRREVAEEGNQQGEGRGGGGQGRGPRLAGGQVQDSVLHVHGWRAGGRPFEGLGGWMFFSPHGQAAVDTAVAAATVFAAAVAALVLVVERDDRMFLRKRPPPSTIKGWI